MATIQKYVVLGPELQGMLEATLDRLKEGFPAISKSIGQYLAEGGAFCLDANGHKPGVALEIEGDYPETIELYLYIPD